MSTQNRAVSTARKIMQEKYPQALLGLCAGSIIRGEGTATSDIDLVVVFPTLETCWRESFVFDEIPVEAFVHDPSTLNYFFTEVDGKSGCPSLPQMVLEGTQVWGTVDDAAKFKNLAKLLLDQGPPPLSQENIQNQIYVITDLLEDLKAPRSREEAVAIAARLYESLGNFALRSKGHWSGAGKQIPRALKRQNLKLYHEFVPAFDFFYQENNPEKIFQEALEILAPFGGPVFSGYLRKAPIEWRIENKAPEIPLPEIQTARLILHPATSADIPKIISYYQQNEQHLMQSALMKTSDFYTTAYWERSIANDHLNIAQDRAIRFYLFEKEDPTTPIGTIGFSQIFRGAFQACYLGYAIAKISEGKGLMFEALTASIQFIFKEKKIHRLMANHLEENLRSGNLLKRLGFIREGIAKDYLLVDGKWRDHVLTSLANQEWKA